MNKKYEDLIYGFLLSLAIILTLAPFFQIGFTIWDDLEFYMIALRGNYWENAVHLAQFSGRFFYIITKPLHSIAFAPDNHFITKLIQHSFLIISYILAALVIKKTFKSKHFALLFFLLLVTFTPVSSMYHVPFISFPFYFTFSFSLLLASLLSFLHYIESGKYRYVTFSVVLFFIGFLFYEVYLVYYLFFLLFILLRSVHLRGFKASFHNKQFYKEILPFLIIGILYMIAYFSYRIYLTNNELQEYTGNAVSSNINWKNAFNIIFKYNNILNPGFSYRQHQYVIESNSLLLSGRIDKLIYVIKHSHIRDIANALIQCFLFVLLFLKMKFDISWKKIGMGIVAAFVFMLSSHSLLAVTDKYNDSFQVTWMQGYVTSYFAYFGLYLIVALLFYLVVKLCHKNKILKALAISAGVIVLFIYSIKISYTNDHIARDYARSQSKFFMIDEMVKRDYFAHIPDSSSMYVESLHQSNSLIYPNFSDWILKWDEYLYYKSDHKINIKTTSSKEIINQMILKNPEREVYIADKMESSKSRDVLLAISKMNLPEIINPEEDIFSKLTTNNVNVYFYSPLKEFLLGFAIADSLPASYVIVNNQDTIPTRNGINTIPIKAERINDKITRINLQTDGAFVNHYFFISSTAINN